MEIQVRCRCGKRLFDLSAYSNLQAHSEPVSKEAPEPTSQRQASAQS